MNAAEWLVGPIDRLVADAEHCVLAGVDVEDTVHMLTRHRRMHVMGSFSLNQHQSVNESSITVICESGVVRMESPPLSLAIGHEPMRNGTLNQSTSWNEMICLWRQADAFLDQLENRSNQPVR